MGLDELRAMELGLGMAERKVGVTSGSKLMPGRSESTPTVVVGVAIPVVGVAMAVVTGTTVAAGEGIGWRHMVI